VFFFFKRRQKAFAGFLLDEENKNIRQELQTTQPRRTTQPQL
jgi:hypothetical protein